MLVTTPEVITAVAVAPVPAPPVNETVGTLVYNEPAAVTDKLETIFVIDAVAAAPEPPPPVNVTVGADV